MGKVELLAALLAENRRLRVLLVRNGASADPLKIVAEGADLAPYPRRACRWPHF